jgi:PAS domain S-box-containing protein
MSDLEKTREQLANELDEMRSQLEQMEACRREFEGVRERYEKILETAPDAMVFVSRDYKISLVNPQMEKLFGYRQEEVVGKALDVLLPGRFRERHRSYVEGYFSNPHMRSMGSGLKIYGLRKNGTEFRADISLSPMKIEGELIVTAAVRDITERVQAQEHIERNYHIQQVTNSLLKASLDPVPLETQLDLALDLILSVPYFALKSKGSIYLVEGETKELVLITERGMTEQERAVCGKVPMGKCLCGRAAAQCEVVFSECVDEGHEIRFEDMFPHGHYCVPIVSGGRSLGLINVYVQEWHKRDQAEDAFLSAVANTLAGVIERRKAEEERQKLSERLGQSEKLAALGRITANVAHEIRNPLTSVGGFARRLQKKVPAATPEREYADSIVSEVAGLERILRDVLAYSRVSLPRVETRHIHVVVEEVLILYGEALREHGVIVEKAFGEVPEIPIDREQVKEAIGNIVLNVIDAMPKGGTLTVSTAEETVQDLPYVALRLRDSGEGIPPENLDRIFEPFFTTRVAKRGIGLGLPISKKIMEDHGGFITVRSTEGKGSTFTLYFPSKARRTEK